MILVSYAGEFLSGLWLTASVSVISFAGALVLGLLGAVASTSRFLVLRAVSGVYVEIVRNIPGLVLIYFIYFGLPAFGVRLSSYVAGFLALSINTGAYVTVTFRTGLREVPRGQIEAARTLGLHSGRIFSAIVLPQAFRTVYPPIVNEFLQIILGSSLLSVISVNELTGVALIVNGQTFRTIETFVTALVLYLLLTNLVVFGANGLARLLFRSPAPGGQAPTTRAGFSRRLKSLGGVR